MTHDTPDLTQKLRQALAEVDAGPDAETLINAPTLENWLGVSQNGFPSLCGRIMKPDATAKPNQTWSRTSVVLHLDSGAKWAKTLNRFYRLSNEPSPSIPAIEPDFGKLALQGLKALSLNEFANLVDAFASRARWYLRQIN